MRRNGGGSLEEAINLTGLFIKDGPVVQIKEPDGTIFKDNDLDPTVAYDGPLIVLTSRFSASASEILAGALQDYDRALIVGDSSTHGKGTVQSLTQLAPILRSQLGLSASNNPGAVKITIRKFYRASGSSTQLKGVTPDIVLPSIWDNHTEIGEAALTNARLTASSRIWPNSKSAPRPVSPPTAISFTCAAKSNATRNRWQKKPYPLTKGSGARKRRKPTSA